MLGYDKQWSDPRGPAFLCRKLEIMIIKQLLLGNLVTDECITDYDNKERVDDE
jgi:hypothetical protein